MSSLGDFLSAMYKKRELEYNAAYNDYKAKVAGAESIGQGIANIGSAVGKIGQGIGGYMQQSAADKSAMAIGSEMGHPLSSTGFGAANELNQRIAAGQFKNEQMTPYQSAMVGQGQQRIGIDEAAERRRAQEDMDRKASLAAANQSKTYTQNENDMQAYLTGTDATMNKLKNADNPDDFETHRKAQIARNQAAFAAGLFKGDFQPAEVPNTYVPKSSETESAANYQRYPTKPVYSPGAGFVHTGESGIPQGAVPGPNMPRDPKYIGTEATFENKDYRWNGQWWERK